jgi:hypothetical protein
MSEKAKGIVFILVVFLSGILTGALLQNLAEHYWLHRGRHLPAAKSSEASERASMTEWLRAELKLSDAQAEQLNTTLDHSARQYDDLHLFTEHIREDGRARIRAVLDPVQRARFDAILNESKSKTKQRGIRSGR